MINKKEIQLIVPDVIIEKINNFHSNKNNKSTIELVELSKLIDKYLIPHELEKKQNAEVSTPFQLRQEMLDTIIKYGEPDFWKTPKKVFEPCAGKGGFLLDVIDRFMLGLEDEEKDSEKRYKLIVEECLYWSELNPVNVFICKLLLDPYGKYRLNYHEGNTLELDIKKNWEGRVGEGFDLVVGNPPYNKNLYKKFTTKLITISKIFLFVIPSTFTIGVSHIKFVDILKDNGLKYIKYLDKNIWNTKIDIDTLYLLNFRYYNGDIFINNVNIKRNEKILNISNDIHYNILKKIDTFTKLELFKGKNKTLNYKSKEETEHIKFHSDEKYTHKLLSRLNGGRKEEIYYVDEYQQEPISGIKLVFPRGTASYNSINNLKKISKPIVYSKIISENILLSTGIVYFLTSSDREVLFLQWYISSSKFVRYLFITENKFSELTKGFVNLIPKITNDEYELNDEFVYKHLELTKEEIYFIEENFKNI